MPICLEDEMTEDQWRRSLIAALVLQHQQHNSGEAHKHVKLLNFPPAYLNKR